MEAAQRHTDRKTGPRLTPGQRYTLKHLNAILKSDDSEEHRGVLHNVERALRARLPEAAQKELNIIRRLGLTGPALEQRLLQAYRDLDLGRYVGRTEGPIDAPTARIICSEGLIPNDS